MKKKTRRRIKKEPRKEIECMRGKSGTLMVTRNDLTGIYKVVVSNRESKDYPRLSAVDMYPHEIARLYDFLGKVLA